MVKFAKSTPLMLGILLYPMSSNAYEFDAGLSDLHVSWVSDFTVGMGIRTKNPSCSLTGDPNAWNHCGAAADVDNYGHATNGNLNYKKGQPFSAYTGITSEVMLTMPTEGWSALIRGTAAYDFAAAHTQRTELSSDAYNQLVRDARLLDAWVQKDFSIADQRAHIRVGNQVINWGESYFTTSGINATNALDLQKLLIPGTQLKQALLPSPMVSLTTSLPGHLSAEAYYQLQWNGNRYPPVGSYWSTDDTYGRGATSVDGPVVNKLPGNSPQYGLRIGYQPPALPASFALYYEQYTDKSPVQTILSSGTNQYSYLSHRQLIGASSNFQVGNWAFGAEISYRPRDAARVSGCFDSAGNSSLVSCPNYVESKKIQYIVNGAINLTPSTQPWIKILGADSAMFSAEIALIDYLNYRNSLQRSIDGQVVNQTAGGGTRRSAGFTVDFNWSYDGSLISGWTVIPGVTYSDSFTGVTPTYDQNFGSGAKSINVYVQFQQNTGKWNAGLNFTSFFGGSNLTQSYGDRNFVGMYATRSF
ncbi:DUF1302 domain-containing protein [Burkholderia cenocepacia]|uniref:DUF1302 domain-containing protein n=1 Tax=Burkholderia cenocepacia TaxID=95486 RepID=UPI002ABDF2B5|nr:DUF1302 family protein [Burkholderia cenocepacia]